MPASLLAVGFATAAATALEPTETGRAAPPPPWPGPAPKGGWALQKAALPKLDIGPANCIDMFGAGVTGGGTNGSAALFDEQHAAGDPACGTGEIILKSSYNPGWTKWMYPNAGPNFATVDGANGGVKALIDLKAPHAISDIWLNHHTGFFCGVLEIFETSPFDARPVWRQLINTTHNQAGLPVSPPFVCNGWGWAQRWCGWNISKTQSAAPKGRYVSISYSIPETLWEMVIYGKQQGSPPPAPPPTPQRLSPLMSDFIGINSFVVEPLARQQVAGWIREYHDWQWDEGAADPGYPHAQIKFSPDYSGFQSDPFYKTRAAAGLKTHVCLEGRPLCQFGGSKPNQTVGKWKAVDENADIGTAKTLDPDSYSQLAAYVYQIAARYGETKVSDDKLTLGPGQVRVSGQGWLSGIEIRNEANGDWNGREAFMTPAEAAAQLSACYDGHEATVGIEKAIVGAKVADPKMTVSMGGLSGATTVALDYVRVMRLWAQKNRKDGKFPADALNFHFYCNDDQVTKGASPEECDFEDVAMNLTKWRDENEPSLQVWLSEFGYDTSEHSPNLAPAYGSFDAQDVQGMWIIRSFLYLALAKIDRAQMFMLADVEDNSWNKFATSGLTTSKTSSYQPKKSWYMLATMTNLLREMRIVGDASPDVTASILPRVARFVKDKGSNKGPEAAYVAWLGSKTGASMPLTIDVSADANAGQLAVLVVLCGNSTNGEQTALPISSGKVVVTVTEMPSFVIIGKDLHPQPSSGPVAPIDPPIAAACKGLPRGLNCSTTTGSSYIICPGGQTEACEEGDRCVQVSPGVIDCKPVPGAVCASKPLGLFCDPVARKAGWPDPYVACPGLQQFYCPTTAPKCKQNGDTVTCSGSETKPVP